LSLKITSQEWEIPTMTVVADNKKRVTLRVAKPGERFDVQVVGDGKLVLTRLEPVPGPRPAKVRIERRGLFSVGVLERPVNKQAIKEVLNEFP
jgi:hypothetical protein